MNAEVASCSVGRFFGDIAETADVIIENELLPEAEPAEHLPSFRLTFATRSELV